MTEDARNNIGLFDLDGSLADYEGRLQSDMEAMRAPSEQEFDVSDLWGDAVPAYLKERERVIKRQPGWWANLPMISSGYFVLQEAMSMGFDCRVLTRGPASNPSAWKEKVEWCAGCLGEDVGVTITRDKSNAFGKFLFDDYPPYARAWLANRPRGLVIMPSTPHNEDFVHPRVLKWTGDNVAQLIETMKLCYARKSGEPMVVPR